MIRGYVNLQPGRLSGAGGLEDRAPLKTAKARTKAPTSEERRLAPEARRTQRESKTGPISDLDWRRFGGQALLCDLLEAPVELAFEIWTHASSGTQLSYLSFDPGDDL
jgi:hypothetical protein